MDLLDIGAVLGGDDPLAAAGEEEGVADFLEGFEVVGVDRGLNAAKAQEEEEEEEEERGREKGREIHGRERKRRCR